MKPTGLSRRKARPRAAASLSLARVLIVEDDPVLAMANEDALRNAGVGQVFVSPSTESALEVLRREQPDAIVIDVHLADRNDGWAIAELIEAVVPNRPKIVFATGSPEEIPEAIAGLGTILVKPFLAEDLIAALRGPEGGLFSRLRGAAS